MGLAAEERILSSIPMSHSYGLASVALPALVRGSLILLADEGSGPFGTLVAARTLDATFFPTVPAFLGALVRAPAPPRLPESLRLVITAGAPLPPETAVGFRRAYDRPVRVFYGSSETGGICFDREGGAGERGCVGEPVEGVRIELTPVEGEGRSRPASSPSRRRRWPPATGPSPTRGSAADASRAATSPGGAGGTAGSSSCSAGSTT